MIELVDGLMTPPSSPEQIRNSGKISIARELTPECAHMLGFHLFNPTPIHPQLAQLPATSVPASYINVHVGRRTFTIQSRSRGAYITISDVLQHLHTEWLRYLTQDEARSVIRKYSRDGNRVGDLFAEHGCVFGGLRSSKTSGNSFDLCLKHSH